MKSCSHKLFGLVMVRNIFPKADYLYVKAFLIGCVEPDYNFITYLRGSVKYDTFRGHNYENSFECMRRIAVKLMKKSVWGMVDYYRFGKLTHYILDAFTYPHNSIFSGNIMEHREYESRLAPKFNLGIMYFDWDIQYNNISDIMSFIDKYHSEYLKETPGIEQDIKYSVNAAAIAASVLVPSGEFCCNMGKAYVFAENRN